MDDIYIAYLYPTTASSTNSTVWPSEDGDQYVYAQQIWEISGLIRTDYPLKAGESCVVAQFAANHRLATYNQIPHRCSSAEFEFIVIMPIFQTNRLMIWKLCL